MWVNIRLNAYGPWPVRLKLWSLLCESHGPTNVLQQEVDTSGDRSRRDCDIIVLSLGNAFFVVIDSGLPSRRWRTCIHISASRRIRYPSEQGDNTQKIISPHQLLGEDGYLPTADTARVSIVSWDVLLSTSPSDNSTPLSPREVDSKLVGWFYWDP